MRETAGEWHMTIQAARAWTDVSTTIAESAMSPDFERTLIDVVACATDSMGGSLWQIDDQARILGSTFSTLSPPDEDDIYRKEFSHLNPIMPLAMASMREGDVAAGADFMPLGEYTRTTFYNEFVRRIGYVHELGALVECGGHQSAMLFVARPPGREEYGDEARQLLRAASPHVRRALSLRKSAYSPAQAGTIAREVLAREGWAAFDREGQLLCLEGYLVDALARAGDLRPVGRAIEWRSQDAQVRWSAAIRRSLSNPVDQQPPLRIRTSICLLEVAFVTVPGQFTLVRPSTVLAVVMRQVADPVERAASRLALEFGLTPAERHVAAGLLMGRRPKEIARDAGTAESTVRSQVKAILRKSEMPSVQSLTALALRM